MYYVFKNVLLSSTEHNPFIVKSIQRSIFVKCILLASLSFMDDVTPENGFASKSLNQQNVSHYLCLEDELRLTC